MATLVAAPSAGAATLTVTTTSDGIGSCSDTACTTLRAALDRADRLDGADTIALDALTYRLGSQIEVGSDVTLTGATAAATAIVGGGASGRVLVVAGRGSLTVRHATIADGSAGEGGGLGGDVLVSGGGRLVLDHVRVTSGTATDGAGIGIAGGGSAEITHSLVDGSAATRQGGGILAVGNAQAPHGIRLSIADSTVTGNTASAGAGIVIRDDTRNAAVLTRSTVAGNSAGSSGAGAGIWVADGSRFTATASIIAGNTAAGVPADCSGTLISGGSNVESGTSCGLSSASDIQGADPGLGPLTPGAGGTPVLPIDAASPAVDLVPTPSTTCAGTDQRDMPRPQGQGCDAGAYELESSPTEPPSGSPDTVILSGPAALTNDSSPAFHFRSDDAAASFDCRLDGPGSATPTFAPCTSPKSYGPLADGTYTFSVRAVDDAGNAGATANASFTVDTHGPAATITSAVARLGNDATPAFAFAASEPGAALECRLDGPSGAPGVYAPCTSPRRYGPLPDGTYTVSVRAVDAAGNAGAAASRAFAIDTTPPTAELFGGPAGPTSDPAAAFSFGSPDTGVTFECRLDGPGGATGAYGPCTSPQTFGDLAPGDYTFRVLARDAAGNTAGTSRSFTVTALMPEPQETVVVTPVRGRTLIRTPGSKRFVPLDATRGIPLGSTVDTRRSVVRLSAIRQHGKPLETALFRSGMFLVTQTPGATQLRLVERLACGARLRASVAARVNRSRRLWGNGKGRFRTSGQFSSATVRGTKWLVQDSCGATRTNVARGVVVVRDFVRHRTVKVRAGHSYTARARGT